MTDLAANLARLRKARDLSQEELAEAAEVGTDTVARIEQGKRRTARPTTIDRLATALGVTPQALGGSAPSEGQNERSIEDLRAAITASEDIPGMRDLADDDRELLSLPQLDIAAHSAWAAYVEGQHDRLIDTLPVLLGDARRFVHASPDDQRSAGQRVLSTAYRLAAGTAGRFGCTDLAWIAAHEGLDHARHCDQPELEAAIATRYLVWTLVRQHRYAEAERVATIAAERIEPRMLDRDTQRAGVFGNLLFNAATAATLAGAHPRAGDLLAEARAAATRAEGDWVSEAAIFGPRVAAFQTIEHTIRAGNPDEAVRLNAAIPNGGVPAFWEAGHRLLMASAELALKRRDQALTYLAEAARLAPDWASRQPLGCSTMQALIDHAPRRRTHTFARLANLYRLV
ncbi:helix-turn-helix domain-containing protein [Sciscionella marina]|uniref:helix-turn-helix domain-containing protein n=1 Tax=Sciscionella marina TaxID=508770 RepID=UPI0003818EE9|nr:XRE family transcriptional regulator [Sciscionella marina]